MLTRDLLFLFTSLCVCFNYLFSQAYLVCSLCVEYYIFLNNAILLTGFTWRNHWYWCDSLDVSLLIIMKYLFCVQKVVFLIPSSLYMINCAALKQNLNSCWIVTVILTISHTHPQCDIHSQTIPFIPLSMRQKLRPGRYLQHSLESSVTPRNCRQAGTPAAQWVCLHKAPKILLQTRKVDLSTSKGRNWSAVLPKCYPKWVF